jgi:uncharacterized protein (DUF1501 family)
MDPQVEMSQLIARRTFLARTGIGIGGLALASLLKGDIFAANSGANTRAMTGLHFAPRAKRVIFLFMSGGPSHLELFDPKPKLQQLQGRDLPESFKKKERFSANTIRQDRLLLTGSPFGFERHGRAGLELSELLPHTSRIVNDIAVVRSMHTDSVNHDPAVTLLQTGHLLPGRPTMGSWVSYGLGSLNQNLPEYVVLLSGSGGQSLRSRFWGHGFLPGSHQGVPLRSGGDPVLYVANPKGITAQRRRQLLDGLAELNRLRGEVTGDPEIATRIHSYEMAYRMQTSVPELMNIASEPPAILESYGAEPGQASFANNCLLARRLAERDVRFIQLFHRDWDHHSNLPEGLKTQCRLTDRPAAALIHDLKQRGLLDETLVIWGGEFGRTPFAQGKPTAGNFGRDHHPRCFTMWLAGGGIKPGLVLGRSDDLGYHAVLDPVHVHDLQATILHCLGVDHKKLTYRSQGRDFRLTDVGGTVVKKLLA